MLSLHKLEIFAQVYRLGSFSAAAEQLLMSQPAVSKHIQDLEAGLGTKLFERSGARGVSPTDDAKDLYDYTCRILKLVAEAENKITKVENIISGKITLSVTQGVGSYFIPTWLQSFGNKYPNLTAALRTGTTPHVVEDVLTESAQLGFVEGEIDTIDDVRLSSISLMHSDMVIVVGKRHAWWGKQTVPIAALDKQAFISRQRKSRTRTWADSIFTRYGVQPRIVAEFDNTASIKTSVSSGLGITILPAYTLQHELELGILHAVQLEDVPLKREIRLLWNNQQPFSPITRAFLNTLVSHFAHLAAITP